jgi:hypothetical protein
MDEERKLIYHGASVGLLLAAGCDDVSFSLSMQDAGAFLCANARVYHRRGRGHDRCGRRGGQKLLQDRPKECQALVAELAQSFAARDPNRSTK